MLAVALREIRHYQSHAMAEAFFIQKWWFMMIVREILQDVAGDGYHALIPAGTAMKPTYRIERDALIALQMCTESLITNIFEMAYTSSQEISEA